MINDEANNYYYFAIKNLSGLNSLGWLQGKRETHLERISKLKRY